MVRSKKYPGVYRVDGKAGVSFGISYTHPTTGQRIRKIVKDATSEAQAADARAIEVADAKRGAFNKAYSISDKGRAILFEDAVGLYLKNWSAINKHLHTDEARAGALIAAFEGKLMSDITPFAVERFKRTMAKGLTQSTVNKYLALGSQVYEKMKDKSFVQEPYTGDNPFRQVKRYKIKKKKKPGSLTPDQVAAIIAEIDHPVKRAMVEFGYQTGWRISEITNLKWDDVNLDQGVAWIADPKNDSPDDIVLSARALEIIKAQPRISDTVFCKLNGDPYKTGLHHGFKAAADRAGVYLPPRKAWHILRRTWASMFLQAGGDVETLRVLGNWKDYKMPLWYADSAEADHQRKTLGKIPKLSGRNLAEIKNDGTSNN